MVLVLLLFLSSSLFAQTGKISGKVIDKANGDMLPGANLIFKEHNIGAATDFDGKFLITNIPVGKQKLTVSYIGYEPKEVILTIVKNRVLAIDVELAHKTITGKTVVVTGQASAQQAAINQQLTSKTIKNIVSSKQIQQLPEANAAEAVGRLPGVSIERSGGEGNKLVIRGMAPKYSKVQIDGVNMAATGEDDRSSDLSMISPYMLEGIELTKSIMANQEANATGGIVNFRIKTAPEKTTFNVIAQGGYNGLRSSYGDYKLSVGGSSRFLDNKFGVYAQGDYEEADRSSHQLGDKWSSNMFSQENLKSPVRTNNVQLQDIFRNVQRIGATVVVDYSLPSTTIKSSNFFSSINREETRYTNTYDFQQQQFNLNYSDTPESGLTILTNSLSIDHQWDNFEINSTLSHSFSQNILPARISSSNNNPPSNPFPTDRNSDFNVDLDPETIPDLMVFSLDEAVRFMELGGVFHDESETEERDLSADLNMAFSMNITDKINVKLKWGGKYRIKNKSYNKTTLNATNGGGNQEYRNLIYNSFENGFSDRTKESWAADPFRILLADFLDKNYDGTGFLDGRYDFGNVFDKDKFRRMHDLVMEQYDGKTTADPYAITQFNFVKSIFEDYLGNEEYYAFYLMPEINLGEDLLIVPGIRFESNRTEYTGYRGNRFGVLGDWRETPIDTVTKVRKNNFILPMIQAFYKPTDWLTIKAGYTHTLQRPNYNNIMPGWVITTRGGIDNLSNFRLKPEKAENWDLQMSIHSDKIGLFSVGAYYKKIKDMIFWTGPKVILDTTFFDLPSSMYSQRAATAINNPNDAFNYGIEVEWQSNFWYLPGFLNGIVISINYTRNKSEAKYLRTVISYEIDPKTYKATYFNNDTTYTSPMISQPDHLLNFTIGYDFLGFSIRGALRYSSGIFRATNWYESLRAYSTDFIRYDLSLKQKLPVEGMELFLNINNLTNEIERDVIKYKSFTRYSENYGRNANLGIRYQF